MTPDTEPKPDPSERSETDRTVSQQAKQQPAREPGQGTKPDEGTHPSDLTTENDGGAQG